MSWWYMAWNWSFRSEAKYVFQIWNVWRDAFFSYFIIYWIVLWKQKYDFTSETKTSIMYYCYHSSCRCLYIIVIKKHSNIKSILFFVKEPSINQIVSNFQTFSFNVINHVKSWFRYGKFFLYACLDWWY